MKKTRVVVVIAGMLLAGSLVNTATSQTDEQNDQVWVCTGSTSSCYHRVEECRGLRLCASKVRQVPVKSAQILGRRQCKMCYKKSSGNTNEEKD